MLKKIWWGVFVSVVLFVSPGLLLAQEEEQAAGLFDSFGQVGGCDAGARLDNFAIALQNEPDSIGYIVGYGPKGDGSGTSAHLIEVTGNYLTMTRGIAPERFQTINAGRYRDPAQIRTQLYIVRPGMPAPEPIQYDTALPRFSGMFVEFEAWDNDGEGEGSGGPSYGAVKSAAMADIVREQPDSIVYLVARSFPRSVPGAWRRISLREVSELQTYGISGDRIKTIYAGVKNPEGEEDESVSAKLQVWILPGDAPPPAKEAAIESAPKEAIQIGSYADFALGDSGEAQKFVDKFADVLSVDDSLNLFLIIRPANPEAEGDTGSEVEAEAEGDAEIGNEADVEAEDVEEPGTDLAELVERWKAELASKYNIGSNRVIVVTAPLDESGFGSIDVWVLPKGAPPPPLYTPEPPEEFVEDVEQ